MQKPEGFNSHISMKEWPQEWKDYVWYRRTVRNHPEWDGLSFEEVKNKSAEYKLEIRRERARLMRESVQNKSEEERQEINKRKRPKFWDNKSLEEIELHKQHMREISQNFWDGMSKEEHENFVKYRESKLTDEQKQRRRETGLKNISGYINNLTNEEKRENGRKLAAKSKELYDNDPEFRERRHEQLAEARKSWHAQLTPEKRKEIGERVSTWWENLPDEEKQKFSERRTQQNYEWWEQHQDRLAKNKTYISPNKSVNEYADELTRTKFPFPEYSSDKLISSWNSLVDLDCNNDKYQDMSLNTRIGDELIAHFHPSIYCAHKSCKPSPYDAWYDGNLIRLVIENRMKYTNDLSPNSIVRGFSASGIAPKVSVFSAAKAKMLINKYLSDVTEIFDPFSGFSGRMLGAISLDKNYIGSDLNGSHVKESNELISFLRSNGIKFKAEVNEADIEFITGTYDALFTCPPYGMKEVWTNSKGEQLLCDEWIDVCLKHFKCRKYLFVVDKTDKYKDNVVDVIINKSHFGINEEKVVFIER